MESALTLALLLAAALAAAPPAAGDPLERRREEIARELLRVGEELRRQIVARDVRALLSRIPADGLRCAGQVVPRARVEADLATPGSWLHDTLLGARAPRGGPASLAELLRTASDLALAVTFVRDESAAPVGRPCLEFRAKGLVTPPVPLCFESRGGRWWFTESLYPCG